MLTAGALAGTPVASLRSSGDFHVAFVLVDAVLLVLCARRGPGQEYQALGVLTVTAVLGSAVAGGSILNGRIEACLRSMSHKLIVPAEIDGILVGGSSLAPKALR